MGVVSGDQPCTWWDMAEHLPRNSRMTSSALQLNIARAMTAPTSALDTAHPSLHRHLRHACFD